MPSGAPYWDEEEEEPSILDTEEAFVNAREGIPGAQDVISNLAGAYEEDPTAQKESGTWKPKTMEELMAEVPDMNEQKTSSWSDLLKLAVPAAGMAVGAATGSKNLLGLSAAAGGTLGQNYMQQVRDKQVEDLRRRQKTWDEANEAAKSLPPEVFELEEFQGLAGAAAMLRKDMEDGKIDNIKSYQNFVTEYSMARDDIDNLQAIRDATNEQTSRQAERDWKKGEEAADIRAFEEFRRTGDVSVLEGRNFTESQFGQWDVDQPVEVDGMQFPNAAAARAYGLEADRVELAQTSADRQYEQMQNAEAARQRDHALTLAALERGQTVDAMNSYQATVGNRIAQAKNAAMDANRQADPAFLDEEVRKAEMTALENDSETIMGFGFQSGLVTEGMDLGGIGSGQPSVTIRVPGRPPLQVDYPPAEQVEQVRQEIAQLKKMTTAKMEQDVGMAPGGQMMPGAGSYGGPAPAPGGMPSVGLVQGYAQAARAGHEATLGAAQTQLEDKLREYEQLSMQRAEVHRIVNDAVVATGQLKH